MSFMIRCPNCQKVLTVQDEWGGMELDCPYCHDAMLIPHYQKKSRKSGKTGKGNGVSIVKHVVRILVLLLLFIVVGVGGNYGYGLYKAYRFMNPKEDDFVREAREKYLPELFSSSNFLYSGSKVTGFKLESSEKGSTTSREFKGTVTFQRNGRECSRPVKITRSIAGSRWETAAVMDWKYGDKDEYLEEDADIFFKQWKRLKRSDLDLKKASVHDHGILSFRVTNGKEESSVYVKISQDEKMQVKFVEIERPMPKPEEIVKSVLANRKLWEDEKWIYYGGKPQSAEVKSFDVKKDKAVFKTNITFTLNGRSRTRPFLITVVRDGNKFRRTYEIDFDYKSSTNYLEEDARYLYFLFSGNFPAMLKDWSFRKAKVIPPGILRITLGKDTYRYYRQKSTMTLEICFSAETRKLSSGRTGSTMVYQVWDWDMPAVRAVLADNFLHGKNNYKTNHSRGYRLAQASVDAGVSHDYLPLAQYLLYECYEYGYGVGKNPRAAFSYCEKAAKNKYPPAEYKLGLKYLGGFGCDKDVRAAYFWLKRAADHGYKDAEAELEKIRKVYSN